MSNSPLSSSIITLKYLLESCDVYILFGNDLSVTKSFWNLTYKPLRGMIGGLPHQVRLYWVRFLLRWPDQHAEYTAQIQCTTIKFRSIGYPWKTLFVAKLSWNLRCFKASMDIYRSVWNDNTLVLLESCDVCKLIEIDADIGSLFQDMTSRSWSGLYAVICTQHLTA